MQKITVELETITPMFLGGADPAGEPELRSPSLRGALRYWTRALLGGIHGDTVGGERKIQEDEVAIWGDTKIGSSIICQIRKKGHEILEPKKLNYNMSTGELYLLWAAKKREYFFETKIEVLFKPRIGAKIKEEHYRIALASFWLLIHLGGIGTRSRRLMGSLKVNKVINWPTELPELNLNCEEPQVFAETLASSIKQWRDLLKIDTGAIFNSLSEFDILHPDHCGMFVWNKKWNLVENLINEFGIDFQKQRFHKSPDDCAVLDVIQGKNSVDKLQRPGFGLPLQFFFRSELKKIAKENNVTFEEATRDRKLRPMATATIEPSLKDENLTRRASPIHFHVEPLNNHEYTIIATFFKSRFLPLNAKIKVQPKNSNRIQYLDFDVYSLIEKYFTDKTNDKEIFELDFFNGGIKS